MSDVLPVSNSGNSHWNEEEAIVDTIRSVPDDGWCNSLDRLSMETPAIERENWPRRRAGYISSPEDMAEHTGLVLRWLMGTSLSPWMQTALILVKKSKD